MSTPEEENKLAEELNKLTSSQLDLINRFKWHPPKNPQVAKDHDTIRNECLKLGSYLTSVVPKGREQSLALTHLEEVMMWANAGIARNE